MNDKIKVSTCKRDAFRLKSLMSNYQLELTIIKDDHDSEIWHCIIDTNSDPVIYRKERDLNGEY